MTLTTRAETSSRPRENNLVQVDSREAGLQEENAPQHQIHYQKMLSRDQTNREETILQQQARSMLHRKKTMKTQAVQVNETNEDKRQINGGGLNRPDHPRTVEEKCL